MQIVIKHIDLIHDAEYDLPDMEIIAVVDHPTQVGEATLICRKVEL